MRALVRSDPDPYRTLVEEASDAICVHDLDGRLAFANRAAEALTGRPRSELVGLSVVELATPSTRGAVTGGLEAHLKSSDPLAYEFEIARPDGVTVPVEASSRLVLPAGGPAAIHAIFRDTTGRTARTGELRRLALHDPLTGMPNRLLWNDRLESSLRSSARSGRPVSVLVLDLDHFKDINDGHGHQQGDEALRAIAIRLRETLRASDTVARLGGDEFGILLPETDAAGARAVGAKLLDALRVPVSCGGRGFRVGASIGAAVFPEHADSDRLFDASVVVQRADSAMYAAKHNGGGFQLHGGSRFRRPQPRRPAMSERYRTLIAAAVTAVVVAGVLGTPPRTADHDSPPRRQLERGIPDGASGVRAAGESDVALALHRVSSGQALEPRPLLPRGWLPEALMPRIGNFPASGPAGQAGLPPSAFSAPKPPAAPAPPSAAQQRPGPRPQPPKTDRPAPGSTPPGQAHRPTQNAPSRPQRPVSRPSQPGGNTNNRPSHSGGSRPGNTGHRPPAWGSGGNSGCCAGQAGHGAGNGAQGNRPGTSSPGGGSSGNGGGHGFGAGGGGGQGGGHGSSSGGHHGGGQGGGFGGGQGNSGAQGGGHGAGHGGGHGGNSHGGGAQGGGFGGGGGSHGNGFGGGGNAGGGHGAGGNPGGGNAGGGHGGGGMGGGQGGGFGR